MSGHEKGFILNPGIVVTPDEILEKQKLEISDNRIKDLSRIGRTEHVDYPLDDFIIYPGLINAHDHLLGSYYPKVGDRRPYLTWKPWDDDLKSSPIYAERSKNENIDLYYLGCYRNLLSGVLTVSDHIPHVVNDPFIDQMPIRVLRDYALAHEVSEYDLKWGDGVDVEYNKAKNNNEPFITHIEEGFDEEAPRGVDYLLEMNALGEHTVLIHGIALSDEDIQAIADNHAHLVWCPESNYFMFNRTARVKEVLEAGANVSLGTDSPMSGSLNILEEMRFAKKIFREMYSKDIDNKTLVKMATINPAKALRLDNDLGEIAIGKKAEFIALEDNGKDPYEQLVGAELEDIALIFYEGKPLYANIEFAELFKQFDLEIHEFSINNKRKIMSFGNPLHLLEKIRNAVGFHKEIPFLPVS